MSSPRRPGRRVSAEEFLADVLQTTAQPIWVVGPEGRIRFANPAAIAALGYDSADELFGRHAHEHRPPEGTTYRAAEWPMLRPPATGEIVARDLDWLVRRDGSTFAVSYVSVPIEMPDGRGAVVAFSDAEDRVRAEQLRHEHEAILAAQRRVATLVAGGAASTDVFAAIAREVGRVVGVPLVAVWRYEPDRTATVVGAWGERPHPFQAGSHWPLNGPTIIAQVLESGRPVRIDDYADIAGAIAAAARETGMRSSAGAPIIVDGDVWGAMATSSVERAPLPDHIEDRLAEFTALVATAISNSASREELARLADEQAALRRVATLVARESPPAQVFAAVAEEVGRLLQIDDTTVFRYEDDNTVTVVASSSESNAHIPVGGCHTLEGDSVVGRVRRTGRPARIDDYAQLGGALAADARERGLRAAAGAPILVEGRLWGVVVAGSRNLALPAGTEERIAEFTELVATAISNVEARRELAASRTRIVAAIDEERRRIVRDLHDGAQQRLVHTVITLMLAREALQPNQEPASELVSDALDHAQQATEELRELSHGILPAVLSQGGLRAGINSLASRMPVPVEVAVSVDRLPAPVEATAYFVVAEALTNVAKHSRAGGAAVTARIAHGMLRVEVRDDGIGGARLDGSGLLGLADRLAALDGRLQVESPPDGGTLVAAAIPLPGQLPAVMPRAVRRP